MGLDTSNEISFRRHVLYQSFPDPPGPGVIVRTQLSGGKNDLCIFFRVNQGTFQKIMVCQRMKWTHSYTSEHWRCRRQKHVCSPQAQTNISAAEAEAADASAKQWLGRQNIGRAGGEPCKKKKNFIKLRKSSLNKHVFSLICMKQK